MSIVTTAKNFKRDLSFIIGAEGLAENRRST